jgi:hypothetical protein
MTKKPWLKSEERFLNENYPHMTATEISGHLGRSVMSVQQRAFVIGIQAVCRSGVKTEWTKKKGLVFEEKLQKIYYERALQ